MTSPKELRFPIGYSASLAELQADPYPLFARLRESEPLSWIPDLNMWFMVGYEDVRTALLNTNDFTTTAEESTILATFGPQMLSTETDLHEHYRNATKYPFSPQFIRSNLEATIADATTALIGDFRTRGEVDLRLAFAAKLPIRVILKVCGLPAEAEPRMRRWYDSFEAALANFRGDSAIRETARQSLAEFHGMLDELIEDPKTLEPTSLLATLAGAPGHQRLGDDEIKRNLAIIFFGAISTVEALFLNTLWALFEHPAALRRVTQDPALLGAAIEETMRWLSPVQSATRHATRDLEWRGISILKDDIVNCMLGAANRDPTVFRDPDCFDLDRSNVRRHLGFATGSHACLGMHLAKAEARIALDALLRELPRLSRNDSLSEPPTGYEFRRPRRLTVNWNP